MTGPRSPIRRIFLSVAVLVLAVLFLVHRSPYTPVTRAQEAVLRNDLAEMRRAIENYTSDQHEAPRSLQNLVDAKYLREVPLDPCTRKKDWVPVFGDVAIEVNHKSYGIIDVHSASDNTDSYCEFTSER